ncbi:conserved hypothetical protein [Candidatus Defluviicoccus seviourii]|uniref:Uncharacterized protein n=1 Tax=Candidatus Defluviicoccus seviourii TaxID=2565273 RepID=A0A564WG44_9PROT|nr:conserved hypothetical protein [Candidatus Defluviicoccus seviourii]
MFLLVNGEDRDSVCLSHCNVAELPRTGGKTLRVNWVLLAPKYDYEDTPPELVADIATAFVRESIRLSRGELIPDFRADHIKMRLHGLADKALFEGIASTLKGMERDLRDVGFRGNWLHMSNSTLASRIPC